MAVNSSLAKTIDAISTDMVPSSEPDVKMSDRDLSFDSRTLLSNTLATTAQNDIERKYIEEYQSKIATINEEQNRLTELRAELKELSFAPGKRDMNRINTLRDETTKIANKINTYDKQLLKLQASKPLEQVVERERLKAQKKATERSREVLENYRNRVSLFQGILLFWHITLQVFIHPRRHILL